MAFSIPSPFSSKTFVLLLWSFLCLYPACLQLESPHTFAEEEDVKARNKDLHRYYQDLEDAIRLEQYHIKLLRDALDIKLTSEQALAEQIDKKQKEIEIKKKDLKALEDEIKSLDAQVKQQAGKRQSTQAALDAERKKTGDLEKSIRLESARTERARLELVKAAEAARKVEAALAAAKQEIATKEKEVAGLKKRVADLDKTTDAQLALVLDAYEKRIAERSARMAARFEEVKNGLTSASLGLERLQKGVEALQKYYQAKEAAQGDLKVVQECLKQLLDSFRTIQDVFEIPPWKGETPEKGSGNGGGRVPPAAKPPKKKEGPAADKREGS